MVVSGRVFTNSEFSQLVGRLGWSRARFGSFWEKFQDLQKTVLGEANGSLQFKQENSLFHHQARNKFYHFL